VFRLPVSGLDVLANEPSGADELAMLETPTTSAWGALDTARRLATALDGAMLEWPGLTVCDLDAALLRIHQRLFDDLIRSDGRCAAPDCAARVEIEFRIRDYLAHHEPKAFPKVEPAAEAGWFALRDSPVSFRLPTAADQIAVASDRSPERELVRRCVRPAGVDGRTLRRVEGAMEALAPSLNDVLVGQCSECGTTLEVQFDPQQFVLLELCGQAAFVFDDVHLIALHYHWPEPDILALPRSRRVRYAEMVRSAMSAA